MRQISPAGGTNVVIEQQNLPTLPVGSSFDQIVFKLSYLSSSDQGTTLGGRITASADLLPILALCMSF